MPWLEVESSSELNDSRRTSRSRLAKQRTVDVVIWQTEVYVVEDIEEISPDRKASVLSYREPLDNGEIDFIEPRSIELVTSDCALSSYCNTYGSAAGRRSKVCTVRRARIPEEASRRAGVRSGIVCSCRKIRKAQAGRCEISTLAHTGSGTIRAAENTVRVSSL